MSRRLKYELCDVGIFVGRNGNLLGKFGGDGNENDWRPEREREQEFLQWEMGENVDQKTHSSRPAVFSPHHHGTVAAVAAAGHDTAACWWKCPAADARCRQHNSTSVTNTCILTTLSIKHFFFFFNPARA